MSLWQVVSNEGTFSRQRGPLAHECMGPRLCSKYYVFCQDNHWTYGLLRSESAGRRGLPELQVLQQRDQKPTCSSSAACAWFWRTTPAWRLTILLVIRSLRAIRLQEHDTC